MVDCRIEDIYITGLDLDYWETGDPTGTGNSYALVPVLPGYALDFEPDRNGPDQCRDIEVIGGSIPKEFRAVLTAEGESPSVACNGHLNGLHP